MLHGTGTRLGRAGPGSAGTMSEAPLGLRPGSVEAKANVRRSTNVLEPGTVACDTPVVHGMGECPLSLGTNGWPSIVDLAPSGTSVRTEVHVG